MKKQKVGIPHPIASCFWGFGIYKHLQCPTPAADLLTCSRVTKGKEADKDARNLKRKKKKGREYDYFDYIAACNKLCIVPCVIPQPLHEPIVTGAGPNHPFCLFRQLTLTGTVISATRFKVKHSLSLIQPTKWLSLQSAGL